MEFINSDPSTYITNYWDWWTLDPPGNTQDIKYSRPWHPKTPDIASGFHTFGMDWSPSHLNFYYDHKLVRTAFDRHISNLQMFLILNLALENNVAGNLQCPTGGCAPYEIDYVKVYSHKCSSTSVVNTTNVNFETFDYSVKKSITIDNSRVPSNKLVVLRATDVITLKNFSVPLGSELHIIMTQCE